MNKEDEIIQKLFDKIEAKKQRIEKLKRPDYKTNLQFSWDESTRNVVNLNTVNDVGMFVKILSHIISVRNAYDQACQVLEVKVKMFTYGNFTYADWVHDIKVKVDNLNINNEKRELKELEDKLNTLVSPEMRRKLELEAIAKQLED